MVPFLRFNLAKKTSVQSLQGGGQTLQEPNSVKAPAVEAECEENLAQRKWQAQHAGNWQSEKQAPQKAHTAKSQILEDLRLR